tara:strand:+ start:700 stop:1098 length:399 start_codon:yes stop_codon:yes gene_type:complete
MKKSILEIYALAICFFAVVCVVFTLSFAAWNVVKLTAPSFTLNSYQYGCMQTNDTYKNCYANNGEFTRKENPQVFPTGEALTKARVSAYQTAIHGEQRNALQDLVQEMIILIIALLLFGMHWKVARRSRDVN